MAGQITIPQLAVYCIKALVFICDIITYPVFFFIDKPWNRWKLNKIIWSELEDKNDPYSSYIRQVHHPDNHINGLGTMDQLFRHAVSEFGNRKCFGTRQVFGEEEEKMKSGKVFKKLLLGEYQWLSYNEINQRVEDVSKGLLSLGIQSRKPIVLLAETRVEWIITAQACFRINVPVVTLYATLGEDGLVHGINETEVSHIITSVDLLPKLKNVLNRVPSVTHVVYMKGLTQPSVNGVPKDLKMVSFADLESQGRSATGVTFTPPEPEDLAILMYTSGSTGVPKGVMVTNRNVITTVKGFHDVIGSSQLRPDDIYIAYLPAAHVLELAAECYLLSFGVPIGFSSPQTLTDFSTAVKKGSLGDLKVLKPTLMASVPLMMDRIRKSILQLAGKEGTFSRLMFDFAINYKHFWSQKGFQTPMLDSKLMKTYHDFLGGKLRLVMCGGAPISPDTQDFIRSCLNVQLLQGYGMTETAASSTLMDMDDFSTGRVGAPLSTCKLRLVDWEDGRYFVTDRPNPRGEIVVGGDCVTLGYFKNEAQTLECFKEEKGRRWFYTGDIGEVHPNGTFQIIDRKKDLVKLQFGEYVALGKVEAELKTCPLVENICVYGNSLHSYLVALVVPNRQQLSSIASDLGKANLAFEQMCADSEITVKFTQRIKDYGKQCRLFGAELPNKIKLCSEDWIPESGLVTAAFKLRRKIIEEYYKGSIESMYITSVQNGVPNST